ncbi:MAG TPA: aldehyde dehydrogenase family protein, partial [Fimbriimonadaceae bacterium]|nr:aldehyde dehydrogenase family protein [Fimbriimonadaceae bacterium]
MDISGILTSLTTATPHGDRSVSTPIDGSEIGQITYDTRESLDAKVAQAANAFQEWRDVPAPKRGELVRVFGNVLRDHKEPLAQLVTIECGKIIEEGRGEVQEMIDVCDFAVGLSRQLYGLTIKSERRDHTMQENWLPLGPVGVISAFNFPVAVWAWNAAIALVCGDPVVWKPSEKTPLTALACKALFEQAVARYGGAPEGLCNIALGAREVGEALVDDKRLPLISAT